MTAGSSRVRRPPRPSLCALVDVAAAWLGGCAGAAAARTGAPPVPGVGQPVPAGSAAEGGGDTGVVEVTLLHFNDVYEIGPIDAGKAGGLARVATLRKRLAAENPLTLTLLAGDFLSPSAIGTAVVGGERLAGRQMVAVLNAVGLDVATFGNHEFDLKRPELEARLAEIEFPLVSGNVTWDDGTELAGSHQAMVLTMGDPSGARVRIGLLGATIRKGAPDYVRIADPIPTLAAQAKALRPQVDVLIALTHLTLDDDADLAAEVPELDLILGGHEHENYELWRGGDLTPVLKADANVRTVYVVRLRWDPAGGGLTVDPELVPITDAIAADPEVEAVVDHWTEAAFAGFRAGGFDPERVVAEVPVELDGRESVVRNRSDGLTDLIAASMQAAAPGADAAVFNAGSIRIDDVLPPGPLTEYDVIRILPFGGEVTEVEMAGGLLRKVLDQGVANAGSGGLLHYAGIDRDQAGGWRVGGAPLDPAKTYRVALTDFLLTGREKGLDYLLPGNPDLQVLGDRGDVRKALIAEVGRRWPPRSP
jgi:5'-nucleotidase